MPVLQYTTIAWPGLTGLASSYWLLGALLLSYIGWQIAQVSRRANQTDKC